MFSWVYNKWQYLFARRQIANDIFYDTDSMELETGDLIFFSTNRWYSRLIRWATACEYSHMGMIIREPRSWLNPNLTEKYYIIESGSEPFPDSDTQLYDVGVQITSLKTVVSYYMKGAGKVYYRRLKTNSDKRIENEQIICETYNTIKNSSYDINPLHWFVGYKKLYCNLYDKCLYTKYRFTNSFFCSSLVCYLYVKMGLISENVAWSIVCPADFNTENRYTLQLIDATLEEYIEIK